MDSIFSKLPNGLILLDGGMGQELINRGVSGQGVLWSAKALFDNPAAVQAVHEDYIRAGANVITTNSYACIRNNFEPEGLLHRLEEMNQFILNGMIADLRVDWTSHDYDVHHNNCNDFARHLISLLNIDYCLSEWDAFSTTTLSSLMSCLPSFSPRSRPIWARAPYNVINTDTDTSHQ